MLGESDRSEEQNQKKGYRPEIGGDHTLTRCDWVHPRALNFQQFFLPAFTKLSADAFHE